VDLPNGHTHLHYLGFHGGAIGDHVQVFYTNDESGLSLLLDPTIGLVAQATLDEVLSGQPVTPNSLQDFYQWGADNVEIFRSLVRAALQDGAYRPSDVWYFYGTLDSYFQFVDVHATATSGAWRWRRDYAYFSPATCGSIDVDTTWEPGEAVREVTCPVIIAPGATLTITAGSMIKFYPGTGLFVGGALNIAGTSANPVILTSMSDDNVGGDTNGDGAQSSPTPGDWIGLRFYSGVPGSTLSGTVVSFGGSPVGCCEQALGAVTLNASSPSFRNTTVAHNHGCGLWMQNSQPFLLGNRFYDNSACGLHNASPELMVNASLHWWGDASGPYEPVQNPSGQGNSVYGVQYIPWATDPNLDLQTLFLPLVVLH
jgi:hypothetical protein